MDLKQFRTDHNLSMIDFACRIGVHINTYTLWERGAGNPSDEMQIKLDEAMAKIEEDTKKGE